MKNSRRIHFISTLNYVHLFTVNFTSQKSLFIAVEFSFSQSVGLILLPRGQIVLGFGSVMAEEPMEADFNHTALCGVK